MYFAGGADAADELHRSFAALRMTTLGELCTQRMSIHHRHNGSELDMLSV